MATDFDRDRTVRSDVENIFEPLARRFVAPGVQIPSPAAGKAARTRARRRDGLRWLTFAAPVLVILFIAALALRYGLAARPADPPRAQPVVPAPARAAASEAPAPRVAPLPMPTEPPVAVEARSAAAPAVPRADEAPAPKQVSTPPATARPATAERQSRRAARATASARTRCAPGSRSDYCIYQDVSSADARLRAAYQRATRDGVRVKELSDIRRRWVRARRRSLDDPDQTIRRYYSLAGELDRLSQAARR